MFSWISRLNIVFAAALATALIIPFFLLSNTAFSASNSSANQFHRVYTRIAVNVPGPFKSVVGEVSKSLGLNGWKVAGSFEASLPSGDNNRGVVIIADNQAYDAKMTSGGKYPLGAFGLPLRVAVYTTPNNGTVVSMVNLPVLARTFSGDSFAGYAAKVSAKLRKIIIKAVGGTPSNAGYGPKRKGRFPSGLGGGSFPGSVVLLQDYTGSTDSNLRGVANLVRYGIEHGHTRWFHVYEIDRPQLGFIEFGVGAHIVTRDTIKIVSHSKATSGYKYPGIDHIPAYPIEILVYRNGKYTNVSILNEMWRMKYYLADAGILAFVEFFALPGDVQSSLKSMIMIGLGS